MTVAVRRLTARAAARAVVAGDDDPLAVVGAVVEDAADELAARADLAAPDDVAGLAVERPEHAGLLTGAEQMARAAANLHIEEDRVRAEVGIWTSRRREREEVALRHLLRPAQGACLEIEGEDRVGGRAGGVGVVVARRGIYEAKILVDGRCGPDRDTVVGRVDGVVPPHFATGVRVERNERATERRGGFRGDFLDRRAADDDETAGEDGGREAGCGRIRVDGSAPVLDAGGSVESMKHGCAIVDVELAVAPRRRR